MLAQARMVVVGVATECPRTTWAGLGMEGEGTLGQVRVRIKTNPGLKVPPRSQGREGSWEMEWKFIWEPLYIICNPLFVTRCSELSTG